MYQQEGGKRICCYKTTKGKGNCKKNKIFMRNMQKKYSIDA